MVEMWSLGRKSSHKREMLHKQGKNYLFIKKSAEMSPCQIRSLLDYDSGQCAESSHLKWRFDLFSCGRKCRWQSSLAFKVR